MRKTLTRSLAPHSVSVRIVVDRDGDDSLVAAQVRQLGYEVTTVHKGDVWEQAPCSSHRSIWMVRASNDEAIEYVRGVRRRFCEDGVIAVGTQDVTLLAALLEAGADQAIPTVSAGLLQACLVSLTRRLLNDWSPAEHVHIGRANSTIRILGSLVQLRKSEFRICEYLIMNRGRWVTERELLQRVLEVDDARQTSVVRVHVNHIRKALGHLASCVSSERGRGYTFNLPGEASALGAGGRDADPLLREVS